MREEGTVTRGLQARAARWLDLTASTPGSVTVRCFLLAILPEWRSLSDKFSSKLVCVESGQHSYLVGDKCWRSSQQTRCLEEEFGRGHLEVAAPFVEVQGFLLRVDSALCSFFLRINYPNGSQICPMLLLEMLLSGSDISFAVLAHSSSLSHSAQRHCSLLVTFP